MALRRGTFQDAENYAVQALDRAPDHAPSLLIAGSAAFALGHDELADKHLSAYLAAHPDDDETRRLYGAVMTRMGRSAEALRAIGVTPELLRENPNHPVLLRVIGQVHMVAGNPRQAVDISSRLVERDPDSLEDRYRLAGAYEAAGDQAGLERQLTAILDADLQNGIALFNLARLRVEQRKLDAAKKMLAQLQAANPEAAPLFELEGRIATLERRPDDAIRAYQTAISHMAEPNRDMTLPLVRTQWNKGDHDGALATLRGWLDRNEADVAGRALLADYHLHKEQLAPAIAEYEQIVALEPRN